VLSGRSQSWDRAIATMTAFALVVAALAGCGGGNSNNGTTVAKTVDQQTTTPQRTSGPTRAVLQPVGNSKASGTVAYKKKPDGTPLIQIRLKGLKPISGEQQYVIWQLGSRHDMLPVASYYAGKDGRVFEDVESSTEPFLFLEDGSKTNILVTYVAQDDDWRNGLSGGSQGGWDPLIVGKHLLEGQITGSLVGGDGAVPEPTADNESAGSEEPAVKTTKKGFGSGTVTAVLHPVGDNSEATGDFEYTARLDETRLIKLQATGLEPASGDRQYAVWQKASRGDMVLLSTWHVGADGRLVESWEPNSASQRFLEDGSRTKLLITKVGDTTRLSEATNSYEHIYIGTPVLEGTITGPLVGFKETS
jgi:hypothetical protein